MAKQILVPRVANANVTSQIDSVVDTLQGQAQTIKTDLGEKAFDVLTGKGGTNPEIERELNAGRGQVDTYLSIAQDLQVLAAGMAGAAAGIPVLVAGEADGIKISKPRNVPTMVLSTNQQFGFTENDTLFVQSGEGTHYVQIQKVDIVSGEGEVSDDYTVTAKILGTLVPGLVTEPKPTTSGRSSATKPNAANKPKADASKKPEESQSRARKPRASKK